MVKYIFLFNDITIYSILFYSGKIDTCDTCLMVQISHLVHGLYDISLVNSHSQVWSRVYSLAGRPDLTIIFQFSSTLFYSGRVAWHVSKHATVRKSTPAGTLRKSANKLSL